MAAPRKQGLELNFDGLTDSVTNLVGALILIVVLLIGITQRAVYSPPDASVVSAAGPDDVDRPLETIEEFLHEMNRLHIETLQIREGVTSMEQRLPDWRTSVGNISAGDATP